RDQMRAQHRLRLPCVAAILLVVGRRRAPRRGYLLVSVGRRILADLGVAWRGRLVPRVRVARQAVGWPLADPCGLLRPRLEVLDPVLDLLADLRRQRARRRARLQREEALVEEVSLRAVIRLAIRLRDVEDVLRSLVLVGL